MRRRLGRAALAVLAFAFGAACYLYLTLPDVRPLREHNPRSTAFMELRGREARAEGRKPRHVQRWVPYSRISPHLRRAVLVAEDSAFWEHDGIDFEQVKESININLERMELARGASTITQQLAKNLYLSPSRNPVRKIRELLIARRLEAELSKRRIFELYLNVIEWGDGIYGAEAAAREYFGKPASALTAEEAALMAGAIINPRMLNVKRPSARLRRRQQLIVSRMGIVTPPAAAPAAEDGSAAPDDEMPLLPAPVPPAVLPGQIRPPGEEPGHRRPERGRGGADDFVIDLTSL